MKLVALALIGMVAAGPALSEARPFTENFNRLSSKNWTVADWAAPGENRNHQGVFDPANVDVINGMLRIRLTQARDARGRYTSSGGEVVSTREFGYGVYEFRMRASSTAERPTAPGEAVRGSVSAAFLFEDRVNTEIDIEFEGNERRNVTHMLSWVNSNYRDNQHTQRALPGPAPYEQFYTYRIVWQPGMITYYRDGEIVAQHRDVVPSNPSPFIFNHWGSNNEWWGGWATTDEVRYLYVDWFKYRPFKE